MKNLDLGRPPVLPVEGEFSLFNAISCQDALELYRLRGQQNLFGLMKLKDHITDTKTDHQDDCPALNDVTKAEIDRLLASD